MEKQESRISLGEIAPYAEKFSRFLFNHSDWASYFFNSKARNIYERAEDLVLEIQNHYSQHTGLDRKIYDTIASYLIITENISHYSNCFRFRSQFIDLVKEFNRLGHVPIEYDSIEDEIKKFSTNLDRLSTISFLIRNSKIKPTTRDSTAIFIDGENIKDSKMLGEIGFRVDVIKLYECLSKIKKIEVAGYFEILREGDGRASWLRANVFVLGIISNMSDEDQELFKNIYSELSKFEIKIWKFNSMPYNEEAEANIIKIILKIHTEISPKLKKFFDRVEILSNQK